MVVEVQGVSEWLVCLCVLAGAGAAWPLYPVVIRIFRPWAERRGTSFHQTHVQPVPRAGGVVLALLFLVAGVVSQIWLPVHPDRIAENWGMLAVALAMFGLGFWDDLRPLGARKKLLGQILISLAACFLVGRIELLRNPLTGEVLSLGLWGIPLTVLWLVAFTNLVNLIDGLDGLAGGLSLMLMALLAYVGFHLGAVFPTATAAVLVGGLIAFLRFNFPPARIYLGDGGAYFLGFLTGLLAMRLSHKGTVAAALVAPLFALALPIIDTTLAILRRGLKGLPLFRPDRQHIHHKLLGEGLNQRQTVLVLYGFSLLALLMAFGVFWVGERSAPLFLGVLALVVILAASRFQFAREWFALGRFLGATLEVRKAARYALALCQWFELEAERAACTDGLWNEFGFLLGKLGYTRVEMHGPDGQVRTWQRNGPPEADLRRAVFRLPHQGGIELRFEAPASMPERVFDLQNELAAEAWSKALEKLAARAPSPAPAVTSPAPSSPRRLRDPHVVG
ncbi:undecaprenyl/decaprenyl-phosphate alpha-N-acetylglucosaminyl 1-phosphate transferase [Limisphaera ngatamarikiensis]|uniref:Undecaprenyl/decaprenyl-phosphate alpha-N-acetylglucosaminyl 1-phosphate transferase n=1 Tax=Limisphaera ngatamarikiensis TaxID=1324935 RepID=A0A6M1RK83_9BACT|nr:undecaprenyl/decaprenyl-phosphate alpha-N-acetylglucosaminyl 1-phosphate transferase [Limisphaera ngatamarikiensis]